MRAVGFVSAIAAIFLAALPRSALAQNDYPNRPISLIVPYAAGGVADVAMRMLGDKLSTRLGQQLVIEKPARRRRHRGRASCRVRSWRRLYAVDDRQQHGDRGSAV